MVDRELSEDSPSLIVELLIGLRAEIIQGRVTATTIVERLNVKEHAGLGLVASVIHIVCSHSLFSVPKKLSIGALSYQVPTPFMLARMPKSFNNA